MERARADEGAIKSMEAAAIPDQMFVFIAILPCHLLACRVDGSRRDRHDPPPAPGVCGGVQRS
jgi:hypothetical protein